jgi:hypothetical protein
VFRPIELLQILKEALGIGGDLEIPLLKLSFLYGGIAAPAAAADHLFVSQNHLTVRAPVDLPLGPVSQAFLIKLQEEPLGPFVVIRLASGNFPVPVVFHAPGPKLALELPDVLPGPIPRMHPLLNGRVLRGKPEGIPTHGV